MYGVSDLPRTCYEFFSAHIKQRSTSAYEQNENTVFRKYAFFLYNSITMIPNPVMIYSMATLIFQTAFLRNVLFDRAEKMGFRRLTDWWLSSHNLT